jgi:hypothetical protein
VEEYFMGLSADKKRPVKKVSRSENHSPDLVESKPDSNPDIDLLAFINLRLADWPPQGLGIDNQDT